MLWFLFLPFLSLRFLSGGRTWEAVVVTAAEAGGPGGRSLGFCREREKREKRLRSSVRPGNGSARGRAL